MSSLPPSHKVVVLSALVDSLLSSTSLCREVDLRMEQLAALRREKWKINLKLKRSARSHDCHMTGTSSTCMYAYMCSSVITCHVTVT